MNGWEAFKIKCPTRVMVEIKQWMDGKHSKLYEDNTECIIIGNRGITKRINGFQSLTEW